MHQSRKCLSAFEQLAGGTAESDHVFSSHMSHLPITLQNDSLYKQLGHLTVHEVKDLTATCQLGVSSLMCLADTLHTEGFVQVTAVLSKQRCL